MVDQPQNVSQSDKKPPTTEAASNVEANAKKAPPKNSYFSTVFSILAVSIGPIVFSLPNAFNMVGYASAVFGIVVVSLFYTYNLRLFLKCCEKLCQQRKIAGLTFAESVKFSLEDSRYRLKKFAPFASNAINVLMVLTWGGELSFNVVFMSLNLRHVLANYYPSVASVDVRAILVCVALPCILISSTPNLRLSFFSIVAGTIDLLFLGIVLFYLYFNNSSGQVVRERAAVQTLHKLPSFLAVILFTLNFAGIILPLKQDMKRGEKFNSTFGALNAAVLIICVVDITFGLLGYLRFGSHVQEMITMNLPVADVFIQFSIGAYCLAIYLTYPVYFMVVFRTVWDEWIHRHVKASSQQTRWLYECATRISINGILFCVMLTFPDIEWFTNIGGLICAILNGVFVPSMVQILLLDDSATKTRQTVVVLRNLAFMIVGLILFYFGLMECISDIVEVAT